MAFLIFITNFALLVVAGRVSKSNPLLKQGLILTASVMTWLLLSFLLPHLLPGSPLFFFKGEGMAASDDLLKAFGDYYRPDLPISRQFLLYLRHAITLDLGYSFYFKTSVSALVPKALAYTLGLALPALCLGTGLSFVLGLFLGTASKRFNWLPLLLALQAFPVFLSAQLIQMIYFYRSNFLRTGSILSFDTGALSTNVFAHFFLPFLVLTITGIPATAVFVYKNVQYLEKEPCRVFAAYLNIQAKDIRLYYHIKPMLPEMMDRLNVQIIAAITRGLFVEAVFAYPGLGTLLQQAVARRDYPILQGIMLYTGLFVLLLNQLFSLIRSKYNG